MKKIEFAFQGIDAKTELRLAIILLVPSLMTMGASLYGFNILFEKTNFLISLLLSTAVTVGVSLTILKQLSYLIKYKQWNIIIVDRWINIQFRNSNYRFQFSEIRTIKNLGNHNLRYLTIKTDKNIIKIRVGKTSFAPFSKERDISEIDSFINYLKPYIDNNFNKKKLRNIIDNNIIPNFGVYVRKGDKINYSFINKMAPWQVMFFIVGIGIIIMIFFMFGLFYYIDK